MGSWGTIEGRLRLGICHRQLGRGLVATAEVLAAIAGEPVRSTGSIVEQLAEGRSIGSIEEQLEPGIAGSSGWLVPGCAELRCHRWGS